VRKEAGTQKLTLKHDKQANNNNKNQTIGVNKS
jgi:hypothetical protein